MIEIIAIGVAATIVGVAVNGLAPLFKAVAKDATNPARAVAARQVSYVPDIPLAEASAAYGEPDVYWGHYDYAGACARGFDFEPRRIVHPEGDNAIVWSFFLVKGDDRSVLMRSEGGDLYRPSFQKQLAQEARDKVTRSYQRFAFETRAAEAAVAAARVAHDNWLAALSADAARVVTELKAGRNAALARDWQREATVGDENLQRERAAAVRASLKTVKDTQLVIAAANEQAERDRAEAVRRAADEIELARRLKAHEDRRLAEVAAEQARVTKLASPIPLATSPDGIVFGTRIRDGIDFIVPLSKLQHMLISGVSGAGKSVLMHSLLFQLLRWDQVERLVLIDLKGGVSFYRYRGSTKVEVVYEMPDVMRIVDGLMVLMSHRQNLMRANGTEFWRGGRVFVVIDEYAEIQTEIDAADTKEGKAAARRLAANLVSISRRARALGIVLVCALQRPTVDAMDAAVRNNLNCRICMRAATNQLAASMLDDLEQLPVKPTELPAGHFYYYDASRGLTRLLKAQIAPGVDLADVS